MLTAAYRFALDRLLSERGMTLTELSARVDVTVVNLSILKNGRARAIRFSTLARLCEALHCQPGDLLGYEPPAPPAPGRELPVPASYSPTYRSDAWAAGFPMLRVWARSGWVRRRGPTGR